MKEKGRISLSTYLGNCLEEIAARAVSKIPLQFERSPLPPPGLISPDFLRTDEPAAFIAVTSTPTRNTFQKKKWRYVHEVFSSKQFHQCRPLSINLQLSPPGALQPNDERILQALFDVEIKSQPSLIVSVLEILKEHYIQVDGNAKKAVNLAQDTAPIANLVDDLARSLEPILFGEQEEPRRELWSYIRTFALQETRREVSGLALQLEPTNLRALCFGVVLVPTSEIPALLNEIRLNRSLSDTRADQLVRAGVVLTESIAGYKYPASFGSTVRRYGPELLMHAIRCIKQSDEASHIIRDLEAPEATLLRVADVLALLKQSNPVRFTERLLSDFKIAADPKNSTRLEMLDYAILSGSATSTEMDRILSSRYEDFSSFNRVQCMISARCQGRNSYSSDDSRKIAERVWRYLVEETDVAQIDDASALERVLFSRKQALKLLGTEANPAQLIFEQLCRKHGIACQIVRLPSSLGDLGIRGRVANVERIYKLQLSQAQYVKVLSGYRGGYEHKAEELAARGWILRYRKDVDGWRREKFGLTFVHEGDWDQDYLGMMLRSGWDKQTPLEKLVNADRPTFEGLLQHC